LRQSASVCTVRASNCHGESTSSDLNFVPDFLKFRKPAVLQSSGEAKHLELLSFAELLVKVMIVQLVTKFALNMGPDM